MKCSHGLDERYKQAMRLVRVNSQSPVARTYREERKHSGGVNNFENSFDTQTFLQEYELEYYACVYFAVGEVKGVLTFYRQRQNFGPGVRAYIQVVADYLAILLLLERTDHESKERRTKLEAMHTIANGITSSDNITVEKVIEYACREIASKLNIEFVSIFLERDGEIQHRAYNPCQLGRPPDEKYLLADPGPSLVRYVFDSQKLVNLIPPHTDPKIVNLEILRKYSGYLGHDLQNVCAVPISSNQRKLGVLRLINKRLPDERIAQAVFSKAELEAFDTIADMLAVAIESARRIKRASLLAELSPAINQIADEEKMLNKILEIARDYFGGFQAGIVLSNDDDANGYVAAQQPVNPQYSSIEKYPLVPLKGNGVVELMRLEQRPIFVPNALADPRLRVIYEIVLGQNIKSMLFIPLIVQERMIGTLSIDWDREKKELLPEDVAHARLLGLIASEAMDHIQFPGRIEKAKAEGQISERKIYSALLHDAKGTLHAVNLDLSEMLEQLHLPSTRNALLKIRAQSGFAHKTLSDAISEMREPLLLKSGLVEAIRSFCEAKSAVLHVQFEASGSPFAKTANPTIQFYMLLIVRELITNATTHLTEQRRRDGKVMVKLQVDEHRIKIEVRDNGSGPPNEAGQKGHGMKINRELADGIRATLVYDRCPVLGGCCATVDWQQQEN